MPSVRTALLCPIPPLGDRQSSGRPPRTAAGGDGVSSHRSGPVGVDSSSLRRELRKRVLQGSDQLLVLGLQVLLYLYRLAQDGLGVLVGVLRPRVG